MSRKKFKIENSFYSWAYSVTLLKFRLARLQGSLLTIIKPKPKLWTSINQCNHKLTPFFLNLWPYFRGRHTCIQGPCQFQDTHIELTWTFTHTIGYRRWVICSYLDIFMALLHMIATNMYHPVNRMLINIFDIVSYLN